MKQLLAAICLLALAGCATFDNPVANSQVVTIEAAYGVTLTAAVAYRKLCADKVIARATCAPVVQKLQDANRKVTVAVADLRKFVRDNPTLNPLSLISAVQSAVADFQAIASQNGVK